MRRARLFGLALLFAAARPALAADSDAGPFPELEPLIITAPRLRLPPQAIIDPIIGSTLLRLLQQESTARLTPQDQQDASVGSLVGLTTATGYKLKTRYTELGFLLTEGLAGVKDQTLSDALETVARQGTNPQTRAAAMVALAYTRDSRYLPLFQSELIDSNVTVRFGALESLIVLGDSNAQFMVSNAARQDASDILRIYAAGNMWKGGDIGGRDILFNYYQNQDWFLRAMATRYIGQYGGPDDYVKLFQQLTLEQDPTVKTELCAAMLRLTHP